MSTDLRALAHARMCDAFDAVAPTAPTLCAGWDAHDLAVHLWILKHDPLSWPGEVLAAARGYSRERAARLRSRWTYHDLVRVLRHGPQGFACMPGDALEGHRHAMGEYVVHTYDVTRPNGVELPPPQAPLEQAVWRRLRVAAPALHLRRTPGLVLRRPDGASMQVTPGRARTRVTGVPTQLLYWTYGRPADVEVETAR